VGRVKLVSDGEITESGAGVIDARSLAGSSAGAVTLSADNDFHWLDDFAAGDNFALTDDGNLKVRGIVDAGSNSISLTTTGTDKDIRIKGSLTGGTVSLDATGEVLEAATGDITADLLNVTAGRGIKLMPTKNAINALGTDQTTKGPNKVAL
jgi:hypothetical protein